MEKLSELAAKRAEKFTAFEALIAKMDAEDYVEVEADKTSYDALKKEIAGIDARVERVKEMNKLKASGAIIIGQGDDQPANKGLPAQALVRYSGLKSFKDRRDEKGVVIRAEEQAYRMGMFILATMYQVPAAAEWCRSNGIIITRAQSEGVNSAGGFLVPEEMMNIIIDLREQFGVFRREAQVVPMGRDTMNWPRRTGGVTAYFVAEGIAPTESTATWDNVNLTAKKLAALVRLSTEIAEDAIVNVADWIVSEIAYAFSSKEDDCAFNGDGTSTYGGIRGLTTLFLDGTHTAGLYTATGHATFQALDATDITALMGLLPYYALGNAKFYCSQYAFAATFERLIAAGGGNSIATLNGEIVYRYLGFPVVISQKMQGASSPSAKIGIIYGDMRKAAALGERRQVSIKRSDERYFDTDQIGIMGTERVDVNVHDLGDTATAGPLVALKIG